MTERTWLEKAYRNEAAALAQPRWPYPSQAFLDIRLYLTITPDRSSPPGDINLVLWPGTK